MEVHGCGVITPDGRGLLLTGHSGAGKSTSARLWSQQAGARVLSDDRIILRREKRPRLDVRNAVAWRRGDRRSRPLAAGWNFCSGSGAATMLRPLSRTEASAELYARSFVPHHSAEAVTFILEFFSKVTSRVPCFEFSFVPDFTAVEALLREELGKTNAA